MGGRSVEVVDEITEDVEYNNIKIYYLVGIILSCRVME